MVLGGPGQDPGQHLYKKFVSSYVGKLYSIILFASSSRSSLVIHNCFCDISVYSMRNNEYIVKNIEYIYMYIFTHINFPGFGLHTQKFIPKGEYRGELISKQEGCRRELKYEKEQAGSFLFFI